MAHFFRSNILIFVIFLYSNVVLAGGEHCGKAFVKNSPLQPYFTNKDGELVGKAALIPYDLAMALLKPHLTANAFPFYEMIMTALWQERITKPSRDATIKGVNERYLCLLGTLIEAENDDENGKFIDEMSELYCRFDDVKKIHRRIIFNAVAAAESEKQSANDSDLKGIIDEELKIYEKGIEALDSSKKWFDCKFK